MSNLSSVLAQFCSWLIADRSQLQRNFLPIWSCSVWGLPCPRHCCRGGALLPHLFTLTPAFPPWRYVFCGTFRRVDLNPPSRTLSGTLLCGVRTFLSPRPKARRATARSGCLRSDYRRRVAGVRQRASGVGRINVAPDAFVRGIFRNAAVSLIAKDDHCPLRAHEDVGCSVILAKHAGRPNPL
jgi:hypothetical protein